MSIKIDPAFTHLSWDEWVQRYVEARAEAGFKRSVELPDPVPLAPPLGYKKAPSLRDQIREMVLSERLRMEAEAAGAETFEEADDFDVPDLDPTSPFEEVFDPVEDLRRRRQWEADVRTEADRRDRVDFPDRFPEPQEGRQGDSAPPPSPKPPKGKKAAAPPPAPDEGADDVSS